MAARSARAPGRNRGGAGTTNGSPKSTDKSDTRRRRRPTAVEAGLVRGLAVEVLAQVAALERGTGDRLLAAARLLFERALVVLDELARRAGGA